MQKIIEKKIIVKNDNILLIDLLSNNTDLSKQVLKSALDKGCVWLKVGKKINRTRRVKKPLKTGQEVFIYFNEKILSSVAPEPQLLLDKKDYSVWLKPAGVFAQGSKWGDHCALTRLAEKATKRNSFLVHRLDRATSGVMLLAHTKTMAQKLSKLFADRHIHKRYLAIVEGQFPNKEVTLNQTIDDKHAVSRIECLQYENHKTLLQIQIETGRKHQIRKHLAHYGYPIIGDRLYGNADKNTVEDLQLQATSLSFICPINGENMALELKKNKKIML